MNRRVAALIILAIILVGGYAGYYAYAKTYLIPKDIEVLKNELKVVSQPIIPEEGIQELEGYAAEIENLPINDIPKIKRKVMADDLREEFNPAKFNQLKQDFTKNREIALRYDLILMGDVASDIRAAYSDKIINLIDRMLKVANDAAKNMENGDNKALAKDVREFANLCREFNKLTLENKPILERVINKLEQAKWT